MSHRTKVVGARTPLIWMLIILAVILIAVVAVAALIILPQQQQRLAAQERAAQTEQRYQAGAAFEGAGDWAKAAAEYEAAIVLDAGYKDVQTRLAGVKARIVEAETTATALAVAETAEAGAAIQATATAEAEATAAAEIAEATATAEALQTQYQRAIGYINMEKWAEAKAELDSVFAVDPAYEDVQDRLVEVESKLAELGITPEPTTVVAAEPIPEKTDPGTAEPTKTPTPTPVRSGAVPAGNWSVRSYNTDDMGMILVNGKLAGVSVIGDRRDTDWISIDDLLIPGDGNQVVFASWNDRGPRIWGFSVKRDDVVVWGSEEAPGDGPRGLSYVQGVSINQDGSVKPIPADTSVWTPPPGKWYVRVQDVDDMGAILVNNLPVAAAINGQDSGWVEITGQLRSDQDNLVNVTAWNYDGSNRWKFSIKRDDTIVWSKEGAGSENTNPVLDEQITIGGQGELVLPEITGEAEDQSWAVRSYNTDDMGAVFVNGKLAAASVIGDRRDTSWVDIGDLLVPGQDNRVVFASWNDRGPRIWGFAVRRNDVAIWGSEEAPGDGPRGLSYVQEVSINSDGDVQAVPTDTSVRTPPPGKWYVRVQDVDDLGVILVNGLPVAAAINGQDSDWVEITNQLRSDQDNEVTAAAWNFDAAYKWKFSIKRDDTIVWAVEKNGSGVPGLTLSQPVTITGSGEFVGP